MYNRRVAEPEFRERYHALDAVRAAAMMLGIFFHGAISFMHTATPWAIHDRATHPAVDLFVWICHTFRMPVFFVMSGFFARLVYRRLGAAAFLRHRVKRILVPFLVALAPTMVAVYFLWRWGWSKTPPPNEAPPGFELPSLEWSKITPSPAHLWFLYYLLIVYAALMPLLALGRRFPLEAFWSRADAIFELAVRSWVLPFVMAIPTAATLFFMESLEADTPVTFVPHLRILAYYAVFFAFGWMLHRRPALIAEFPRRIVLNAVFAVPLLFALGWLLLQVSETRVLKPAGLRVGGLYLSALFGWSMILLFVGVFVRWLSEPRAWVRWLADSSYWCYLVHLPVVVFFQILVAASTWPGVVKYALVMTATLIVCVGSYRAFVRYTFLGTALGGKRERTIAKRAASPAVAEVESR